MDCMVGVAPFHGVAVAIDAAVLLSDVAFVKPQPPRVGVTPIVRSFLRGARSSLSAVAPDHILIEGGLAAA